MKLKLFLLTALSIIGLTFSTGAWAVGPLTIRLGQPKSPTNQDNFKLTFVALEIGGVNNITVACYKKSPSDSDYVKFDTDKILIAGGNTDYCNVDSSILNTVGTYYFKVTADASKESNIVSVDYNTSGPSTPEAYSKEKLNSCDYKIKFKSADDGRTFKVELFRSDSLSIAINSGSIIATKYISPNTEGEFVNTVPDCTKDYYYAIRAVDNADNASGITGDSFTKVTTTTVTETTDQGTIVISEQDSQVTDGETATDEMAIAEDATEEGTPEVLGTETSRNANLLKWLSIPLILLAVFFFRKARKKA